MNEFTFLADTFRTELRPDLLCLAMQLARTPFSPLYRSHVRPDPAPAPLVGSVAS